MSFEDKAGLIELTIFYSIAIGFCVWQLISVRRLMRRDKEAANVAVAANPSSEEPSPPTAPRREPAADRQATPVTPD